jgi:thiol-disulfide isomerase/thioredoxin
MPIWLKRTLYLAMIFCSIIIGLSAYLELNSPADQGLAGNSTSTAPDRLPDFTLNDVWGEAHAISEWSGQPLLINFWATWCAPCRREMPLFQALHNERTTSGITVVGIAIDRQPDVQSYIAEAGISYSILVGEADAMAASDLFGLPGLGLPFSVLVSSDGSILTVHIGEIDAGQLRNLAAASQAVEAGELSVANARLQLAKL